MEQRASAQAVFRVLTEGIALQKPFIVGCGIRRENGGRRQGDPSVSVKYVNRAMKQAFTCREFAL